MSQSILVVLSVGIAATVAATVSLMMRPNTEVAPNDAQATLQRELAELRSQNAELLKRVDNMVVAPAPVSLAQDPVERVPVPTVSAEQVAAAVEAYLKKRTATGQPADSGNAEPFDLDQSFAELAGTSYWDNAEAWKKVFASGRMDEVIAKFEAAAKASPNDTRVQMQLAGAYLSNLQVDQSQWQLSMKADKVFDHVLELEPTHWEARFTKALSYTFYPDFLGKKKDAIKNFETLVEQQESMPVEESQAQTYLYLGNLLEARDPAKAKAMWAKGARRHPGNQELAKKAGT